MSFGSCLTRCSTFWMLPFVRSFHVLDKIKPTFVAIYPTSRRWPLSPPIMATFTTLHLLSPLNLQSTTLQDHEPTGPQVTCTKFRCFDTSALRDWLLPAKCLPRTWYYYTVNKLSFRCVPLELGQRSQLCTRSLYSVFIVNILSTYCLTESSPFDSTNI